MASTFSFVITTAGLQAAVNAQVGGPKINITQVRLGSAVAYTPVVGDTGLHGTELYAGPIFSYTVNNPNEVQYTIRLDQTIGDFSFGEAGLYLADGTLFALGALETVQEKVSAKVTTPGNLVTFVARLVLNNIAPYISFPITQIINARIFELANLSALPIGNDLSQSNAFNVLSGDEFGNSILALRNSSLGIWSLGTHQTPKIQGTVDGVSTDTSITSVDIGSFLGTVEAGKYILQFTSGVRKSYVRDVLTTAPNVVTFDTLGGVAPSIGDTFVIYQSNFSIVNDLVNIQAQLDAIADDALINAIVFSQA